MKLVRRWSFLVVALTAALLNARASAATLDLTHYQREDGAITVHASGDRVDPYFASKALLAANTLGLDIATVREKWIDWALNIQNDDGRFDRYCLNGNSVIACEPADADDATLAVWIELLLTDSGTLERKTILPSLRKSEQYLSALLLDRSKNLYLISRKRRVALLMDNIEVLSALQAIQKDFVQHGDIERARVVQQKINKLYKGIVSTYWNSGSQSFRISTQEVADTGSFYPHIVGQVFPLLTEFAIPNVDRNAFYLQWLSRHRDLWMKQGETDYPWGLVALIAYQMQDHRTTHCWLHKAEKYRHSARWNVLEEAIWQGLKNQTTNLAPLGPC